MAQVKLQPNSEFVRELQAAGGETLKKCYQCATCSVACPVSPANSPYPRKEMVWASWGLKDKLENDIDLWLCHNCGNCADLCPRGARPADLMSAARNMVYRDLTEPVAIGRWMSSIKGLPFLVAIPAMLFFIIWMIRASIVGAWFPRNEEGLIVFSQIFHILYVVDPVFMLTFFSAVFVLYKGVMRLIDRFKPEGTILMLGKTKPWYMHLYDVIVEEIITHKKFSNCQTSTDTSEEIEAKSGRKWGHMILMFSFGALLIVTTIVAAGSWFGMVIPALKITTPLSLTNPVKILANLGAIAMITGLVMLSIRRMKLNPKYQGSSYYDWYLLGIIWVVAVTGILSQVFRLMNTVEPAYCAYYLHLVSVWMLFAYLPWSKLGHFVYRTAALTYVRMVGRS